MGEDGESRAVGKRREQVFAKRRNFAFVEDDAGRTVREGERAPQLGIFEVSADEQARADAGQVVATQAVPLAKTGAGRDTVADAEQFAVAESKYAVVAVVVDECAGGAEYSRAGYRRKTYHRKHGAVIPVQFFVHVESADDGTVQTQDVAAFYFGESMPERVFGRYARNTDIHALLYATNKNPAPCGAEFFIYGVPEESL